MSDRHVSMVEQNAGAAEGVEVAEKVEQRSGRFSRSNKYIAP